MIYHISVTLRVPDEAVDDAENENAFTETLIDGVREAIRDTFYICKIKHGEVESVTVEGS